jgi:hypothetical protein
MSPRGVRRDCPHPGSPHTHGTREAYILDSCRCAECRQANAVAEQERRREIAYGRWQPFADAEPVRHHLRALGRHGIGLRRIAELSGVPYTTLTTLLYGAPSAGAAPSQRARQDTARRILAVALDDATPAAGARIDATGTRRRIQALVAIGWTINAVATELGRDVASVRHTLRRNSVNTATATAVCDLYKRLWNTRPDESTQARRQAATNARDMARSKGWRPAMAWDDIDADPDPNPTPPTSQVLGELDDWDMEIVTDRIAAGQTVRLSPAERDVVIQRLTRRGFSLPEIADLLALTPRTVSRRRKAGRAA